MDHELQVGVHIDVHESWGCRARGSSVKGGKWERREKLESLVLLMSPLMIRRGTTEPDGSIFQDLISAPDEALLAPPTTPTPTPKLLCVVIVVASRVTLRAP